MMTTSMQALIKAYQTFSDLFTEIEPILAKDAPAAISFSQYVRNFCLAMIVRVDASNPQHRNFVNNLTLVSLPEMDEEEYRHAVTAYDAAHYDEYIYGKQEITQKLLAHDLAHKTRYMTTLVNQLCRIADIFASQNYSFKQPIQAFCTQFRNCADVFVRSGGSTLMNGKSTAEDKPDFQQEIKPAASQSTPTPSQPRFATQAQPKQKFSPGPTVDGQYWLRVIVPMLAMIAFIMGAVISEEWVLLLIAIAPLFFMIAGLKAAQRRCPNCGAWDSMVTIKSKCIGQQKVKVRRNLNSSYYRTSGTHTFGSRQVFVSADEYTYSEVYRCNICGHQVSGTRKSIDDGIR